jgi:hypothetical protein
MQRAHGGERLQDHEIERPLENVGFVFHLIAKYNAELAYLAVK